MPMTEKEQYARWAEAWDSAGKLMEEFRADDLQALTDEKALWMFESVTGNMVFPPRHDDGLLEQQRWFKKLAPCLN